jgi:hypothetical protein
MVFETLLRCGGNMVIPGTDKNALRYRTLASEMGLYITHHHAEPLGAEMFARAYPDLPADVIKIWADNGYGKMVSRRQMNHNPRIAALPPENDSGKHGICFRVRIIF